MIETIVLLKSFLIPASGLVTASVFLAFFKKSKKRKSKLKLKNPISKKLEPKIPAEHTEWSLDLLMALEWKRYEEICKEI